MNKILKVLSIGLIIFFLSLYLSRYNSYYNQNKSYLVDEAIKRYESDLKSGKDIVPSNYVVEEKNYNNKASIIGIKLSKLVENIFSKGIKSVMKYLDE